MYIEKFSEEKLLKLAYFLSDELHFDKGIPMISDYYQGKDGKTYVKVKFSKGAVLYLNDFGVFSTIEGLGGKIPTSFSESEVQNISREFVKYMLWSNLNKREEYRQNYTRNEIVLKKDELKDLDVETRKEKIVELKQNVNQMFQELKKEIYDEIVGGLKYLSEGKVEPKSFESFKKYFECEYSLHSRLGQQCAKDAYKAYVEETNKKVEFKYPITREVVCIMNNMLGKPVAFKEDNIKNLPVDTCEEILETFYKKLYPSKDYQAMKKVGTEIKLDKKKSIEHLLWADNKFSTIQSVHIEHTRTNKKVDAPQF